MRSAQSAAGMTSGCLRYSRRSVSAAFFLTKDLDVLPRQTNQHLVPLVSRQIVDARADEQAVDVWCERFRHVGSANIRNGVQGKAIGRLVHLIKVFADRVDDESDYVRILVHEEREREVALFRVLQSAIRSQAELTRTHNLLLRVFRARNEVDCLHMTDIDGIAENRRKDDLRDVPDAATVCQSRSTSSAATITHFFFCRPSRLPSATCKPRRE